MFKYRFLVVAGAALFILDRLLKYYVLTLPPGEVFSFLNLDFGYFLNPALFFLPAWPWIPWLALIVLVTLTALFGFWVLWPSHYPLWLGHGEWHKVFLPILLGGASNVFDRFMHGGVIDIIYIHGLATINLADILILSGVILLLCVKK